MKFITNAKMMMICVTTAETKADQKMALWLIENDRNAEVVIKNSLNVCDEIWG